MGKHPVKNQEVKDDAYVRELKISLIIFVIAFLCLVFAFVVSGLLLQEIVNGVSGVPTLRDGL